MKSHLICLWYHTLVSGLILVMTAFGSSENIILYIDFDYDSIWKFRDDAFVQFM